MEFWDIYDINGNKTGRIIDRFKEYTQEGEFHLASIVCLVNKKRQLLIQKGSDNKKVDPGKWSFTGGAVLCGENAVMGAVREIQEELGISVQPQRLMKLGAYLERNAIFNAFIAFIPSSNLQIKIQKEELSKYKWVDLSYLEKLIKEGKVAPNAIKAVHLSLDYLKKNLV